MATGIGSPLALGGLYPSVDGRYVAANGKPFTSVSNAESALNGFPSKLSESCVGYTVLVKESGWTEAKEYWVQPKGTTPETYGLVEKGAGVTDYNDLDNKPTIGDGTNTALPIVGNVKVSAVTASGSTAGVTVTPGQNTGEIEMHFSLPKSDDAYEVYLEEYKTEHGGSVEGAMSKSEWLASLKGERGDDAVNPFKGYYPSGVSKPATGAVGDYLYAPPSDSQSTATATIWHYDSTQTPPWTDTEIDVSAVVGVEFGSGQAVNAVKIKDESGEEVSGPAGVLSAEAGKNLNEQLNGVPSNIASNGYMDVNGIMHAITTNSYETSDFIPVSLEVGDVLEFTEGENYNVQSRLCFFEYNTPTTSDPDNNKATTYKAVNAAPKTYTVASNDSTILSSNYIRMCWGKGNRSNVYIKLNDNIIYRPTAGTDGDFVRKEEFTQELGIINQTIGTKSQESDLEANDLWGAVDELNEKTERSSGSTKKKVDASGTVAGIGFNENNDGFGQSNSFTTVYLQLKAGDEFSVSIVSPSGSTSRYRIGYTTVVPSLEASATPADPNKLVWVNPNGEVLSDIVVQSACYICISCINALISSIDFYMKKTLADRVDDCENDVANLQEDVAELRENNVTKDENIEQRFIASKFANLSNQSKCLTLLHFSDIHGGTDNLTRIVAFKQQWQSYINDAICTGDIVTTDITSGSIFDQNNASYVNSSNSILLCTGNHDTKSTEGSAVQYWYTYADTQDAYNMIMGNKANWGTIVQPTGAGESNYYPCYYYKDYTNAGVRLIVLDMMSLGKAIYNAGNSTDNLGQNAQIEWLNDVLDDAKTNSLHVVIAQHFPFISKGMYSVTNNADVIEGDFSIPNGDYEYHSGGLDEQISRRALPYLSGLIEDFKGDGGNFVCWICGHTHYDLLQEVIGNEQKVVVISTAKYNASDQRTIRNTTDDSMDLFNIFSVDTTNRIVKVFRIGGHLTPALQKIDTMHFTY